MSTATPPVPPSPKIAPPPAPGAAGEAPEAIEPIEEPKHKISWKKWLAIPAVASLFGTGVSVFLHAVLIALGIMLIPPLRDAVSKLVAPQEQVIVPTAELATEKVGGIPNPGMNDDNTRAAAQNIVLKSLTDLPRPSRNSCL